MARRKGAVADISADLVPDEDERARLSWIIRDALAVLPIPRNESEARRQMAAIRLAVLATLGIEPILGVG